MDFIRKVSFITILIVAALGVAAHPLHLTVCNVEVYDDSTVFSLRLFADDFTDVLKDANPGKDINLKQANPDVNNMVLTYICKHLKVMENNKPVSLHWIACEPGDEAVWVKLVVRSALTSKNVSIENTILSHWFGDQKNLMIIKSGNREQGLTFDSSDTRKTIKL